MICPSCTSRMVAVMDRDAVACELCGRSITGFKIVSLRGSRRGRFFLWTLGIARK